MKILMFLIKNVWWMVILLLILSGRTEAWWWNPLGATLGIISCVLPISWLVNAWRDDWNAHREKRAQQLQHEQQKKSKIFLYF
ncbi:hypothetical protein ACFSR7_06095 [Cohnella sp. GCM10020058]|uniref:hypothetical protein n=1 Tax=Cohnella sp. GCM10020058 TaxID=3317330 RepID=UPI00363CDE2D